MIIEDVIAQDDEETGFALDRMRVQALWERRTIEGVGYLVKLDHAGSDYRPELGVQGRYGATWVFGELRYGRLHPAQSTLYRALRRLEDRGALQSRWESIEESQVDGRDGPPRRYYTITATGVAAAKAAVANSERAQRAAAWQTWVPSFESR